MDIIGHLAVIEHAGTAGVEVWGEDALFALLPNLAHCHEWAYDRLRETVGAAASAPQDPAQDRQAKLIEGHIITDWVIHYGPKLTPEPQRIGWAYQEMSHAIERMDHFFDDALRSGITDRDPRHHDTREHLERDFGHTSVECALDFRVGGEVATSTREGALRTCLEQLADPFFRTEFIAQTLRKHDGYTREPAAKLDRTMREYGQWAEQIDHPEDFAALTLCTKYDWPQDRRTVDYVLEFLREVERSLDPGRAERLVDEVVAAIADPASMAPDA